MASRPSLDRVPVRLDRQEPHLRLHHVAVYVRDLDRSTRFYRERLGFGVLCDVQLPDGGRWVAVGPPDGTAFLGLVAVAPRSPEDALVGRSTQVVFPTEDVPAKGEEWRRRDVRFRHPPETPVARSRAAVAASP